MKEINLSDVISKAWAKTTQNFGLLVGLMFTLLGLQLVLGLFTGIIGIIPILGTLAGMFISIVVGAYLQIGQFNIFLNIYNEKKAQIGDLFENKDWNMIINVFVVQLLTGLVVFGGLLLLIIPGIYWALMFSQGTYLVIEKKLDPVIAMKKSAQITKGHKLQIFLLGFTLFGINLLGILCLFIGLLWTVPLTWLATLIMYKELSQDMKEEVDNQKNAEIEGKEKTVAEN